MHQSLKYFFRQFPPFILLGIAIALLLGIFIIFSYVLIWGLCIGAALWGINSIIQYVRTLSAAPVIKKKHQGRVIDHDPS